MPPKKSRRTHSYVFPYSTHHAKVSTLKGLRRNQTRFCELLFFVSLQVCTSTGMNPLLVWYILVMQMMYSFSHSLLNMTLCHFSSLQLHGKINKDVLGLFIKCKKNPKKNHKKNPPTQPQILYHGSHHKDILLLRTWTRITRCKSTRITVKGQYVSSEPSERTDIPW